LEESRREVGSGKRGKGRRKRTRCGMNGTDNRP